MENFRTHLQFLLYFLLFLHSLPFSYAKCTDTEREALLAFKTGLTDPSGRLSSWRGDDCCKWAGVKCSSNQTVTHLDLKNPYPQAYKASCLAGNISSSLLRLPSLSYLDMSLNDFQGNEIPAFLGQLNDLTYLNLSFSSFGGEIPPQLGNLSKLQVLDLTAAAELRADDLNWLTRLASLNRLNMGFVRINTSNGGDWLHAVSMLPSLVELKLQYCQLQVLPQSLPLGTNFPSLSVLDLSDNSFNAPIPQWLFNLTGLRELYLRWNFLHGPVPSEFARLKSLEILDLSNNLDFGGQIPGLFGSLRKLKVLDLSANDMNGGIQEFISGFAGSPSSSLIFLDLSSNSLEGQLPDLLGVVLHNLQHLDLSSNRFWGSIPNSVGEKMSSLKHLDISYNNMNGSIPDSFGQLSALIDVNLVENSWVGVLKETHMVNLRSLENFKLTTDSSNHSLIFNVPVKWVPPFKLKSIQLENCIVGPSFPAWLQVQNQLTSVTLRNVGISDTIPGEWFSNLPSELTFLVLSSNQITGKLPSQQLKFPRLSTIDLSSNKFEGPLPMWSTNASILYLQDNKFSGSIPENFGKLMPRLQKVYLSQNQLVGKISSSMCDMQELQILSLRNNRVSGEIPDCWYHSFMFWAIDVSNNSLTGKIPASFGSLRSLSILLLSSNRFDGEIPASLQNCTGLTSMDLGKNRFSGVLPSWIGTNFSSLSVLDLSQNLFNSSFPEWLSTLTSLTRLDLSTNSFSGSIAVDFGKFESLEDLHLSLNNFSGPVPVTLGNLCYFRMAYFKEETKVVTKGRAYDYNRNLALLNVIDFSENNLSGPIPEEMTKLLSLRVLNLSSNHISGAIPEKIGDLKVLETLDLSHNQLSGEIPATLSSLTFLTHLIVSYNNFSGKIPAGRQLQTFDASSYQGNPFLCGFPSRVKCPTESITTTAPPTTGTEPEDEEDEIFELGTGLYVSIVLGFGFGFLGLCVTLLRKEFRKKDIEW
ncbi:unnamed protein product [Linum tenue]|uniref:Leucine-rich repeat-containing N-terminal plant-type domain-containing protein n=1 Tax=Linum tenue TaxID=586396 RepID=A0AAV0QL71_9ROSI|nr:unnamed protein product [Linum tenue]